MDRVGWAVAFALQACASRQVAPPPSSPPIVVATPTVITAHEEETPVETFQRARALLLEGRAAEAAPIFDRLTGTDISHVPADLAQVSRFNSGVAWEQAGDREKALARFRQTFEQYPAGDAGKWGGIRASRLEAYLEQWSELSATSGRILLRSDLSDVERLEALGAKGLSLVELGDPDAAERFVAKARDIIEAMRLGEGGKLPVEAAQAYFALGEIRRARSEAITFVPVPKNFAGVLEQRCQGLLDAQSAYSDAMRSYDAHWAAMSGFRIGELYQRLYRDVMSIGAPRGADTEEKKQLFAGAMRLRYGVLLEKGLTMMEHTIMLGARTGEASAWVGRAREAKEELEKSLSEQKVAMAKLPYSEKELRKALADLSKQKK